MSDLHDMLDALSKAHGPRELAEAFWAIRGRIKRQRLQAKKTEGVLGQSFIAVMDAWVAQKKAGATHAELLANAEKSVRAMWPFVREWKYVCETCGDYGLEMHQCSGDAACGRVGVHQPHEYGTPCWCARGRRFKALPPSDDDPLGSAAKRPTRSRWSK